MHHFVSLSSELADVDKVELTQGTGPTERSTRSKRYYSVDTLTILQSQHYSFNDIRYTYLARHHTLGLYAKIDYTAWSRNQV